MNHVTMRSMIEKEEVEALGALARIELTHVEITQLQKEFGDILSYISELNSVASPEETPQIGDVHNVMREDSEPHESGIFTQSIMQEMPATKDGSRNTPDPRAWES